MLFRSDEEGLGGVAKVELGTTVIVSSLVGILLLSSFLRCGGVPCRHFVHRCRAGV